MATRLDIALLESQLLAHCDPELPGDQIDVRDHLGNRMLDLDPRVHLHEVVAAVLVDQELERAGALVSGRPGALRGCLHDVVADSLAEEWRRRLLDDLLMPALERAVAVADGVDMTVRVGQDLDFDVAWLVQIALDVDVAVAERRFGLGLGHRQLANQLALTWRRRASPGRHRRPLP